MKNAVYTVLLFAASPLTFPAAAAVAADPVHAPQLTLSCLDFHINTDKSVDLTCKIQNSETGLGPVIKGVILEEIVGATVLNHPAGDIANTGIAKVSLHYLPNQYQNWANVTGFPNFHRYAARGTADDAIFGNIISHFFPAITGQAVNSNLLTSNDAQQPPQFWLPGGCTYEATPSQTPLSFPSAGGTASLVVDTQSSAMSAPKGCPWVAATIDGAANIANFGGAGSTAPILGPATVRFTVLPNVVLNGSSQSRTYALDVVPSWIGVIYPYHGRFQFTQDGLTCAWAADGFTAPQQGISSKSPATINVRTQPGCRWSVTSASGAVTITDGIGKVVTGDGGVRYSVAPNLTATPRTLTVKLGNITVTAVQPGVSSSISATFRTNPSGLQITVDGNTYTAPQTFQWQKGTPHTIGGTSQQQAPGTLYTFSSWSQGGPLNQTVTPAVDSTYTETFSTSYQITTAVLPAGSGTVWPQSGQYVKAGNTIPLIATPATGYTFVNWTGPVNTPGSNKTFLVVNGPESLTANFVKAGPTTSSTETSLRTQTGFSGGSTVTVDTAIAGTSHPELYQSERFSTSPFEYRLELLNGDYSVTLRFAELHYRTAGNRLFNVSINAQRVLTNFDPATVVGAAFTALDEQFPVTVSDGELVVRFDPIFNAATVSAIEVTPVVPSDPRPPTAIRVHAGGAAYVDASGRVWSGDYDYSDGEVLSTGAPIAGTPDAALYQTQRYAPNAFDYQFAVPDGNYTVVLHFAEIVGPRAFNVSINDVPVLTNFDPASAAGGAFKAVQRTFPVTVTGHQVTIHFESVVDTPVVSAIELLSAQ